MSPLLSLPAGVDKLVLDNLSGKDLLNVRETCKTLKNVVDKSFTSKIEEHDHISYTMQKINRLSADFIEEQKNILSFLQKKLTARQKTFLGKIVKWLKNREKISRFLQKFGFFKKELEEQNKIHKQIYSINRLIEPDVKKEYLQDLQNAYQFCVDRKNLHKELEEIFGKIEDIPSFSENVFQKHLIRFNTVDFQHMSYPIMKGYYTHLINGEPLDDKHLFIAIQDKKKQKVQIIYEGFTVPFEKREYKYYLRKTYNLSWQTITYKFNKKLGNPLLPSYDLYTNINAENGKLDSNFVKEIKAFLQQQT